ncbi:MAG: glycerophosphodiester phosphodiesterase family protein [Janthinobacterium lividum]
MWPYPAVIAHRGAGVMAPENTLAAMRRGLALGFRAVEFDVMLAADGVPVVVHDLRLGRTVAGRGQVPDYSAAQLQQMDAGSWFGAAYAQERVPTFAQLLAFCQANRIWMNVEIKPAPGHEARTGAVVAAALDAFMRKAGDPGCAGPTAARGSTSATNPASPAGQTSVTNLASLRSTMNAPVTSNAEPAHAAAPPPPAALLSSFSLTALAAARQAAPAIARACLFDRLPVNWLSLVRELDAVAVHLNHRHLSAQGAAQVKAAGLALFCYTINDPRRARLLLDWGMDAFCTDRLDLIGPDFASQGAASGPAQPQQGG